VHDVRASSESADEVVLRAPTLEDVDAVVAAINRASQALRGRDEVETREVAAGGRSRHRSISPRTSSSPFGVRRSSATGTSATRRTTAASSGSTSARTRAGRFTASWSRRALVRRSHEGVVMAVADERDEVFRTLLEERGYCYLRSSYRMRIDFGGQALLPGVAARSRRADRRRERRRAAAPSDQP
jgi:hypothetical protein